MSIQQLVAVWNLIKKVTMKYMNVSGTHRLHTMTMTTTAMRKTRPAAAEPMMRGSFSRMLLLYSAAGNKETHAFIGISFIGKSLVPFFFFYKKNVIIVWRKKSGNF